MQRVEWTARRAGVLGAAVALAVAAWMAGRWVPMASGATYTRSPAVTHYRGSTTPRLAVQAKSPSDPGWDKRWWIEKTARLLRGGEGLSPDDDIDALLQLSEEEIARRFMQDARFGDTVLDFNMFFLGFKADTLKSDGIYVNNVFDFPNAISSAQALFSNGDYFKLFDFEGEYFMAPLRNEPPEDQPAPEDADLSPQELRKKAIGEFRSALNEFVASGATTPPPTGKAYCRRMKAFAARGTDLTDRLHRAFDDTEIFALIRGRAITRPIAAIRRAAYVECAGGSRSRPDLKRMVAAASAALAAFTRTFDEISKFEPAVYQPELIVEFKPFDLRAFSMERWLAFGFEQGVALQNSSTNYNRKRSAYVLKRFFCDDLTPVGFEDPQQHVAGAHGSDTSCYACHYKLDPMAGFFRNYGSYFYDYSRSATIIFDDLADEERDDYEATWRAPKGAKRKWNVGYVRSPRWDNLNTYGETLGDLSRIIRGAPEAKRCLMKRLFEYVTAEDQTIDGGYLDDLTRQFEKAAAVSSSTAMKDAIVRVVLSNTYRERNADPDKCYDYGPDGGSSHAPPCRVAFILQKNCAQCHDTAYDGEANLDLHAWVPAPDGKNQTFPHLDADMNQRPAPDTLARIMERLSTNNPKARMPKNRLMSSQERQELYLWAQEELARMSKSEYGP